MERIAVDMDEVIADMNGACLQRLNDHYLTHYTLEHLRGRRLIELFPDAQQVIYDMLHEKEFYRHFEVIEGSQEALKKLSEHYQIVIATAAMDVPPSFDAKYEWLQEHFPFLDPQYFIFCGDKNVVNADYLIDDNLKQLASFEGTGVLFTAMHNINEPYPLRFNDWEEITAYFMEKVNVLSS